MFAADERWTRARSAWEWMWRSRALEAARRTAAEAAPVRELWRRARLAAELADRALQPDVPLADGPGSALAISLYREAAFWALSARGASGESHAGSFTELLSSKPDALHVEGMSEPDLARVRSVLVEQTFVDSAQLERSQQIADAELCRSFVGALLEQAGTTRVPRRAIVRAHFQRGWRTLAVVLLSAALVFYASVAFLRVLRGPDLALGKPWSTSSTWAECHPEHLKCGNARSRIFFHTKRETQPWFLLDLGSPTTFGRVEIDNRDDCCRDRALPLVVEVSDDGQSFREVARRTTPFDTWHATFPATQARFVRLRIDRRDFLHLSRVTVRRR